MKYILTICLVTLTACASATRYEDAVRSEYIGDETYEIRADGNTRTADDQIRSYLYRHAFETCSKEGKGFKVVSIEDTGSEETVAGTMPGGNLFVGTDYYPGARARVKCEGAIDPKLQKKYERTPASR
jgi:hypothetical protein